MQKKQKNVVEQIAAIDLMKILVLCTGNSCRSQMEEGYLRLFAHGKAEIYSAGIETHGVHPKAILCMHEDGVDISHHFSNHDSEYENIPFDFVITVCDNALESCPYFPGQTKTLHCNFEDPSKLKGSQEEIDFAFRKVRDEIKDYCQKFCQDHL
ncbi:arsenate reductase ArsC [bacterium]|nr:arsenate reductase ArsC [bacterium]